MEIGIWIYRQWSGAGTRLWMNDGEGRFTLSLESGLHAQGGPMSMAMADADGMGTWISTSPIIEPSPGKTCHLVFLPKLIFEMGLLMRCRRIAYAIDRGRASNRHYRSRIAGSS